MVLIFKCLDLFKNGLLIFKKTKIWLLQAQKHHLQAFSLRENESKRASVTYIILLAESVTIESAS